ncbi:MAG TPA: SIMPL domain-containing protein [Candidatus Nitrosotenuis sp.]|nr:SIMPL domain-containing protein [Candidatus Nitrosotenuis sp.]
MNKTITIAAAGAILALVFVLGDFSSGINAQAQTEPTPYPSREKTLTVTGSATTSTSPDLLVVQFGVEVQKETAKDALDSNSKLMNAVVSAIKSVGISDQEIKTSQITIYPVYESVQDKTTGIYRQNLVGYSVSNIVRVETKKMDLASNIIDSAVAAGTNRVDSVQFTLSPQKQRQVSDDLLAEAIQNAKSKAEKALVPLDYQIIGVKSVSLSEFYMPPPMPYYKAAYESAAPAMSQTPVFSSDQDVTNSATVVFIIGSNQ